MNLDTEKVLSKMNIDYDSIKKEFSKQRIIPKEWYFDIIKNCIDNCKNKYENVLPNKNDKLINIQFLTKEDCEKFEEEFHNNFMSSVNSYIQDVKKENPKNYSRNIILETKSENVIFTVFW